MRRPTRQLVWWTAGCLLVAACPGDDETAEPAAHAAHAAAREPGPPPEEPDMRRTPREPPPPVPRRRYEFHLKYDGDDPLARELYHLIRDSAAGLRDRRAMEMRLSRVMAFEEMGTPAEISLSASTTVHRLLQKLRVMAPDASGTLEEAAMKKEAMRLKWALDEEMFGDRPAAPARDATPKHLVAPPVQAPDGYVAAYWDVLGGFAWKPGEPLPAAARRLDGRKVAMNGFMWTLDHLEDATELVLVEKLWGCCFGEAPDLHQMVHVRVPRADLRYTTGPVRVLGTLDVGEEKTEAGLLTVYRLRASEVKPIAATSAEEEEP